MSALPASRQNIGAYCTEIWDMLYFTIEMREEISRKKGIMGEKKQLRTAAHAYHKRAALLPLRSCCTRCARACLHRSSAIYLTRFILHLWFARYGCAFTRARINALWLSLLAGWLLTAGMQRRARVKDCMAGLSTCWAAEQRPLI